MKQNSFLKKFKTSIVTVAVAAAFFAVAPFTAFAAAPAPGDTGYLDYAAETVLIDGITNTDCTEYSIDKGKTWYPVDSAITAIKISKFIPAPGKATGEIALRVSNVFSYNDIDDTIGTFVATKGIVIPLPARPAAAGVSYDALTGTFKAIAPATIDFGIFETTANASAASTHTFFTPVSTKVTYTLDAVANAKFKSSEGAITIAPLTKAPAVVFDKTKNVLTKTTPAMQYILDITGSGTPGNWIDCNPGTTDLSSTAIDPANVCGVRYKSVGSVPASSIFYFTATSVSAAAPEIAENVTAASTTADGYVDWDKEVIMNNKSTLQVSFDKGVKWADVKTEGTSIASVIKPSTAPAASAVAEVRVRIKATTATTAASKSVSIFINKRPATPVTSELVTAVDYSAATMAFGANTAYALSPTKVTSKWYTNVSAITGVQFSDVKANVDSTTDVVGKTLEIKKLAVVDNAYSVTPASAALKYKLGTVAPAPATVTYTGLVGEFGSLRGATALMEVASAADFSTHQSDVSLDTDKLFALNTNLTGKNIYVRIKATDKVPASNYKVIYIPAVPVQVTGTAVDTTAIAAPLIAGADSTYEISFGTGSYVVYTKASLLTLLTDNGYKSAVGASPATSINIRKKATIASPAGTVRVVVAASRAS